MVLTYLDPMYPQKVEKVLYYKPCDQTLTYKIGTIDPKFNMSKDQFKKETQSASDAWNKVNGKELLKFDDNGTLTVSMVFDDRQSLTNQINNLSSDLDGKESDFNQKLKDHDAKVAAFKQKLKALNDEIVSWNNKGGAPEDVYRDLLDRQSKLQAEGEVLNSEARELNLSAEDFNSEVSKLNSTVSDFNVAIKQKPEGGIYDPSENLIEVYVYLNKNELKHTLIHEFGHALGLEHVENNPKAIMYPFSTENTVITSEDIAELNRACQNQGILETIRKKITWAIN